MTAYPLWYQVGIFFPCRTSVWYTAHGLWHAIYRQVCHFLHSCSRVIHQREDGKMSSAVSCSSVRLCKQELDTFRRQIVESCPFRPHCLYGEYLLPLFHHFYNGILQIPAKRVYGCQSVVTGSRRAFPYFENPFQISEYTTACEMLQSKSVDGYPFFILHVVDELQEGIPVGCDGVGTRVSLVRQIKNRTAK